MTLKDHISFQRPSVCTQGHSVLFNFNFIRKYLIKLFIASFVLPPLQGEPSEFIAEREHAEITWKTYKKQKLFETRQRGLVISKPTNKTITICLVTSEPALNVIIRNQPHNFSSHSGINDFKTSVIHLVDNLLSHVQKTQRHS